MPDLWEQCKHEFTEELGNFGDIYIYQTGDEQWRAFLGFVRSTGNNVRFTLDNTEHSLPSEVDEIFRQKAMAATTLFFVFESIPLYCFFLERSEIELDFDTRDIPSKCEFGALQNLLQTLSNLLKRAIDVTPENCPESPILRHSYSANKLEYLSAKPNRR